LFLGQIAHIIHLEVDDAKVKEGVKEVNKYYVQFFDVEGFRYDVEVMLPAVEALPLLGI